MMCTHKSPGPVLLREWIGYSVIFLLMVFANCGGQGGAGCVMPLSMIFFGFDIKSAIAISNSSITTSAIVRYVMNFNKPHPLKNGKGVIIDYTIPAVMFPSIVVGVTFGAIVFKMFPPVILAGLLVIVMPILFFTTLKKLLGIIRNEREKFGPLCGKKEEIAEAEPEVKADIQNDA